MAVQLSVEIPTIDSVQDQKKSPGRVQEEVLGHGRPTRVSH